MQRAQDVETILDQVSRRYRVPVEELAGTLRYPAIVRARRVAAYVLRSRPMTLADIGSALGGRNHATVMKSLRVVEADAELKAEAEAIAGEINGAA